MKVAMKFSFGYEHLLHTPITKSTTMHDMAVSLSIPGIFGLTAIVHSVRAE